MKTKTAKKKISEASIPATKQKQLDMEAQLLGLGVKFDTLEGIVKSEKDAHEKWKSTELDSRFKYTQQLIDWYVKRMSGFACGISLLAVGMFDFATAAFGGGEAFAFVGILTGVIGLSIAIMAWKPGQPEDPEKNNAKGGNPVGEHQHHTA